MMGAETMGTDRLEADKSHWLQRWREGEIGFHQAVPSPMLVEFWQAIDAPRDARVFVPLAGKTVDMPWLAARGHRVFGVELAPLAVEQFFSEQALVPEVTHTPLGTLSRAGAIDLLCGDVFALSEADLADCNAVFDRAALIALPADLRRRYVREVYARLPSGCRGLLVTLEYPPHEKQGPPFTVPEAEVRDLFERDWTVDVLTRRDTLAKNASFVAEGVTALDVVVYRLQRR
jgi:thiopurine S-methyltransferase